jgi:hypothetical protein
MTGRTVFLSHTSKMALARPPARHSFVDAALDAVTRAKLVARDMRYFAAADQPPARYCMEAVRKCQIYIGIFGLDYGSPVRDRPDVSYTELEFETALDERERGMRVFAFLLKEDADPDLGPLEQQQAEFRRRVQESGLVTVEFSTPDMLQSRVYQTLIEQLAEEPAPTSSARLREYTAQMLGWKRQRSLERFSLELSSQWGSERSPLSQLLKERSRLVLIGDPGGGKTVFLLKSFRSLCKALQELPAEGTPPESTEVPVYVELAQLTPGKTLAGLILSQLPVSAGGEPLAVLTSLLRHVKLVIFLDGLNELAENDRKPRTDELVALHGHLRARDRDSRVKVVVTTRRHGFPPPLAHALKNEDYLLADVRRLSREEAEQHFCSQLPVSPDRAKQLFAQMGHNLWRLLTNPQHLSYALEWYTDHLRQGADPAHALRTRGALLEHCIRKRLEMLPRQDSVPVAHDVLQRLAYEGNNAAVYFSPPTILDVAEQILRTSVSAVSAQDLVRELREAELLVPSKDLRQFRFFHHSHQQYFAAGEMRARWRAEWGSYVRSELWYEPLVIMAGLLDERELGDLLRIVRPNPRLYAHVLANVDQPEIERQFQQALVGAFIRHVRFWARGVAWLLALVFLAWFLLVPAVGFALHSFQPSDLRWQLLKLGCDVLAVLYVMVVPLGIYRVYGRWFNRRQAALREQDLPQLLSILKNLESGGALHQIRQELESLGARDETLPPATQLLISLPAGSVRLAFLRQIGLPEDVAVELSELPSEELRARRMARQGLRAEAPRLAFLDDAMRQVDKAIASTAAMSEDEMLENIADPLVAARMDVEQLSENAIAYLMERAAAPADTPDLIQVLAKLRELYSRSAEHRESLAALFARLASDPVYSRRRRRRAAAICRSLGISLGGGVAEGSLLSRFFLYVFHALRLRG